MQSEELDMKRLYRSETDKMIGGVCGGLGAYLGMDPLILRILFVAAAMLNGIGLPIYLMMWLFLPTERAVEMAREELVRQNAQEIRNRARELTQEARGAFDQSWDAGDRASKKPLVVGAVMVGIGLLVLLQNLGLLWPLAKLWPLALIALGVVLLMNNLKDRG